MYITDTHPLIFYASRQRNRLSKKVLQIFDECEQEKGIIYIPTAILWETSILVKRGRVKLTDEGFEKWCKSLINKPNFQLISLEIEHVLRAYKLNFHKDPFDLLIVATAKVLDLPLITKDSIITDANIVEVVW